MIEKLKLLWSKTNRWHRGLFIFLIVELKVLPAGQLGFTCKDPALSHPFTGDTISWKLLLATVILLPLVFLLIVERIYHSDKSIKPKQQALRWYKEYLYGVLLNLVIVQTLKMIVGSPRPHFFDTCAPKEASTCEGSEYIPTYTCTKAHWLSQSDRSFPSGHTSLAIHTGIFLAYYLYRRTNLPITKRVFSIQVLCIAAALLCSISRMTDHRHHWWDVLSGALIAMPILYYTINSLCSNFECRNNSSLTGEEKECPTSFDQVPLVDEKLT